MTEDVCAGTAEEEISVRISSRLRIEVFQVRRRVPVEGAEVTEAVGDEDDESCRGIFAARPGVAIEATSKRMKLCRINIMGQIYIQKEEQLGSTEM